MGMLIENGTWFGIIGIVIPVVIYAMNFIYFGKLKAHWEKVTGSEIQTDWGKHSKELMFYLYPVIVVLHIVFMTCAYWFHPDFILLSVGLTILQNFLQAIVILETKGLTYGFYLREFLGEYELRLWYKDNEGRRDYFWYGQEDSFLLSEIVHADYIPEIQKTLPLLKEKEKFEDILENLSVRPLSDYEAEVKSSTEARLKEIEEELDSRWEYLLIAVGRLERPEVLDERKAESVREFESLVKQEAETGKAQKQADPALKELYALTQNEEAPADIKKLAENAIRDIETKLEADEQKAKEEAMRRSAEVVINTSRQFHGV